MAAIVIFLLLLTLTSTINARESQFFAKVSNNNLNNNPFETKPLKGNEENVPSFSTTPQFKQEEGGSFGHESGQLPPSVRGEDNYDGNYNYENENLPANLPENYNPVAYTTPIHSSTQDIPEEYRYDGENKMYNSEKQGLSDTRFLENGKYYYPSDNGYNSQKQGFEDTRFMEKEDSGEMYNSQKQEVNGRYNSQKQGYSTTNNGNMYNTGKQGMSDTRFLENGKYYYDLSMENENLSNNGNNMNSRGYNSRNEYNTQGYYGNNGNNENSYDRYNSNGGYQNQEEFQGDRYNP